MARIKSLVKRLLMGPSGVRPRKIKLGLFKHLRLQVDVGHHALMILGLYEHEISGHIRKLARSCASAIDVGANTGWYTVYFASQPNLREVVALEPDQSSVDRIRENLALNESLRADKVRIIEKFVGHTDAENLCRLDTVAVRTPKPVILKIDVEGAEVDVLVGASRLLASRECMLVVETHGSDVERECLSILEAAKYECRIVSQAWYRKVVPEYRPIPHNRWIIATPDVH